MDKADFFNRWAPSYDTLLPSVFYQAVHVRILDDIQLPAGPQVLDLGCGTGKLLNRLAHHFPDLSGVGLDLSAKMLEQARRKTPFRDRLQFVTGNATALPFEKDCFDSVFCCISFLHYPDPTGVLQEVARVLRSEGAFYLADFAPPRWATAETTNRPVTPGGVSFYSPQARETLGHLAGLRCDRHVHLLGPVLLSRFRKPVPEQ